MKCKTNWGASLYTPCLLLPPPRLSHCLASWNGNLYAKFTQSSEIFAAKGKRQKGKVKSQRKMSPKKLSLRNAKSENICTFATVEQMLRVPLSPSFPFSLAFVVCFLYFCCCCSCCCCAQKALNANTRHRQPLHCSCHSLLLPACLHLPLAFCAPLTCFLPCLS